MSSPPAPNPLVNKAFQDLYVSNLCHKTTAIKDQLESGLYLLKRVGFYLRKVATSKRNCSVELNKFSDHELEKKDRIQKDRMHLHVNAYQQMQHVMTQMAFYDLKFGSDLLDRVAEPLLNWHKDAEARLKKLTQTEEKLEAGINALRNKIKSERASCLKQWNELIKEYKDWQRSLSSGDAKKIEKLEKAFLAKREKTYKAFQKFEAMVEAGNIELKTYWMRELPQIVTAYELLEVERMTELEARLQEFTKIQSEFSQPFPGMLNMIDTAVKGINGTKELKGFVDTAVQANGKPEAPPNFVDGLPADSRSLGESANQHTLGTLLNADALILSSTREMQQMKSSGNVLGGDVIPSFHSATSLGSYSSSSPSISISSASASSSSSASATSPNYDFNFARDPAETYVRALYDFTSEDADDLTFTINTIIKVTLKGEDDELAAEVESGLADINTEPRWWRGRRLENVGKSNDGTFPSNYAKVVGIDKEITLRHLLEIPSGLAVFSEFLKSEFATENISFWTRVEEFRNSCMQLLNEHGELRDDGKVPMLKSAEAIATEFIGSKAASQVNISSHTLKITQDRLLALPSSLSLNMFDEAAAEIIKMMNADSFARFKRHELFERYLVAAQQHQILQEKKK